MNPGLSKLQPYPFERLNKLLAGIEASNPISLTIGEPQHEPPQAVLDTLADNLDLIAKYPATKGTAHLREAITNWVNQRFQLTTEPVDDDTMVLPVTGTREALFSAVQALLTPKGVLAIPNPFYQIYEGAALLADANLHFLDCTQTSNYQIDINQLSPQICANIDILMICTPGNPSGQCLSLAQLQTLIKLAHDHDFIIFSDECYSEIYPTNAAAPVGLLTASDSIGNNGHSRCLAFNSLSKRSNLPGLRSGFVAGDATLITAYLKYRTYHGCAMPMHHQVASACAWQDESHVIKNRHLYDEKYEAVVNLLPTATRPDASFYLWLKVGMCDQEFARQLYSAHQIKVLPGTFLARDNNGHNPGYGYVRIALVDKLSRCIQAATQIADFMKTYQHD